MAFAYLGQKPPDISKNSAKVVDNWWRLSVAYWGQCVVMGATDTGACVYLLSRFFSTIPTRCSQARIGRILRNL